VEDTIFSNGTRYNFAQTLTMNSIKGRILLAFLALCLLLTPFLFFSYRSLLKINNEKYFREQLADFNINRLKAVNTFSQILEHDTKIDSFYINDNTENLTLYRNYISSAEKILTSIDPPDNGSQDILRRRLANSAEKLTMLETDINKILDLQKQRGFKNFGIEGKMRSNIHQLEHEAKGISLVENLSIRRREKDFFLRDDMVYAKQVNELCNTIMKRMSANTATNRASVTILKAYLHNFNSIVAIEQEIGDNDSGLIYTAHTLNARLNEDVNVLFTIVDSELELLTESIRSYLILLFVLTLIFAVVFAYAFSAKMAKPITQLITDMNTISNANFKGDQMVETNITIRELQQLTATYNGLVKKIRGQLQSLNQQNAELNSLNEKLKESEEEIKEASFMKDKFFSIISHDLRGHTGNITTLAGLLGDKNEKFPKDQREIFVKYLLDSSQNLGVLLDNLLNWAKTQMKNHEMVKKSFDITKIIKANFELYQETANQKGIQMLLSGEPKNRAFADKDMIDFVVRNLLSNAVKFSSKGDIIHVKIMEPKNMLEINIDDTGVGMTQDQIAQLLHPNGENFTTEGTNNEKGSGLGFSICKKFIAKNGGKISIASQRGKGSSFIFTVPTSLTKESILTVTA